MIERGCSDDWLNGAVAVVDMGRLMPYRWLGQSVKRKQRGNEYLRTRGLRLGTLVER